MHCFKRFPKGLLTLLVFTMRLGLCNECCRVWNFFPGCLCDSKPQCLGSLSNRFSAMYDNRLNPFGDDEDALSDTPRTPSSAGSFRTRAKYFSTLCFPPPLLNHNTVCSLELPFCLVSNPD